MASARISQNSPNAVVIVAIAMGVLALVGRAVYLACPVNSDTAMYVYMGQLVAHGGKVGVDLLDNKLPTVGLLMATPVRIIGAAWHGYVVIGMLMTVTASIILARAAARAISPDRFWPVLIAALLWTNFSASVFGHLSLETVEVFFTCFAAAAALACAAEDDWRDAFVCGLAAGMAMWAKPTGGAVIAAFVVMLTFDATRPLIRKLELLAAAALGLAVPIATAAYLIRLTGMDAGLANSVRQISDYAHGSQLSWIDAAKPIIVLALLTMPVLIARRTNYKTRPTRKASRSVVTFTLAWLVMELIAVIAQQRMYFFHFLVLGPPAALCMGLISRRMTARQLALTFAAPLTISLAIAISIPSTADPLGHVSASLASVAGEDDVIWSDDYPRLLVEHDWQPGSRVPLIFLFANSDAAPTAFSQAILSDFDRRPPQFIVWPADAERLIDLYQHHMIEVAEFPARSAAFAEAIHHIDTFVHANYQPVSAVDHQMVFERRTNAMHQTAAITDSGSLP